MLLALYRIMQLCVFGLGSKKERNDIPSQIPPIPFPTEFMTDKLSVSCPASHCTHTYFEK
jgi:hypothetical protein